VLRTNRITNIVLTGTTAGVCVHTTMRGGVLGAIAPSSALLSALGA
jgi:nicotinamidase-related amidase